MKVHWCLFDRECRGFGAPPRVYVHFKSRTIYFNPFDWRDGGGVERRKR